jgi:hypothetical protein
MYCFCKNIYYTTGNMNYVFPNGEQYCVTWVSKYILTNYLIYLIPLFISFVNYCSKLILTYLSKQERHQSLPTQIYRSAVNMMLISFVNIGVVILFVNMNAGKHRKIPLLQGSYNTFSVDWYRVVGTSLCI